MALTEEQWQQQVLDLATRYRWIHFHPYDMRRSDAGWPDLVLCRPPEIIFVELKTNRGKLSSAQIAWLLTLSACGVETAVWRPDDFEVVHDRLKLRG